MLLDAQDRLKRCRERVQELQKRLEFYERHDRNGTLSREYDELFEDGDGDGDP